MEKLVATYGKTIHTWHTDQERNLPLGAPMIMMSFTKEGQLRKELITERDQRFNRSTEEARKDRQYIKAPPVDPGADAWEKGVIRQIILSDKADSALHKH